MRITPADAGKTVPVFGHRTHNRDHPRRCGENFSNSIALRVPLGSPPQVRGKLTDHLEIVTVTRITPAGAGKTYGLPLHQRCRQDHPRRCGENCCCPCNVGGQKGSPPQVRGKRHSKPPLPAKSRITPAGAGKTPTFLHCITVLQDHPRRCGENCCTAVLGSGQHGITPAGAGKTNNGCIIPCT